jgi:hypothetical protein
MSNKNDDFNFEDFAVQAIQLVDSIRSYGREGGTKPRESRINAFYRAIGLPAVVPVDKESDADDPTQDSSTKNLDKLHNGNVFSEDDLAFSTFADRLFTRQIDFEKDPSDDDIEDFLDLNKKDLRASILESAQNKRPSGILFPMIVDGSINVYPQSRRIRGAFVPDSDLIIDKITYKRPLIEMILNIKLKGENIVNKDKQSDVSADFQSGELKLLDAKALNKLKSSLNNIDPILEKAVRKANRIRKNIGVTLIPTIANVAQQNPEVKPSTKRVGELDRQKAKLEEKKRIADTILSLFEFDDVAGTSNTRNLRDAALAGPLLSIISPQEKTVTEKELEEVNEKIDNATAEAKSVFRTLDLLLGTFSGLSGLDIIVVFVALFELRNSQLVALLNDEAKDNLEKIKGKNLPALVNGRALSVSTVIRELETKVKDIFDDVVGSVKITKHREKRHNQTTEGTQ